MKNREEVRDALAALLEGKLVAELDIVQEVVSHKVGDLEGQGPIVAVLSAGSDRSRMTGVGNQSSFGLDVQVWTPYGGSLSEAQAEDRADLIEAEIAGVVEANQRTDHWQAVDYSGRSEAADVVVSEGVCYLLEVIPLEVRWYG